MDPQTTPQQTFSGITGGGEISLYQYFIASPLFAGFKDPNGNDRKIFLSQYIDFSPSLKNYLASTETATVILSTAQNYELDDGQTYQIAATIRELLTGKVFIKDFPITLSSKLGIDDIKAGEIVNKIISQSFGPIIEDLKRVQRSKFPDKIMQMQKEARPEGLNQASAKPAPIKTDVEPPKPTEVQPQRSIPQPSALQQMRPIIPQGPKLPRPEVESQRPPEDGNGNKAQKSLEEELEKVANVIDLRNKPKD